MKQTAVEWLIQQLSIDQYPNDIPKILQQAKEIEKEQILQAYNDAISKMDYFIQPESAEQYYNETYGSKGSDETKQ